MNLKLSLGKNEGKTINMITSENNNRKRPGEKYENKICVWLSRLETVYFLYLKQLTHFKLRLFSVTTMKGLEQIHFRAKGTNGRCFVFVTSYLGEVTTGSDWNLRSNATLIVYLRCYNKKSIALINWVKMQRVQCLLFLLYCLRFELLPPF